MSQTRVKPLGWGLNEQLTSAQINQLDINIVKSLDRTAVGDTIEGAVELESGAGLYANTGSTLKMNSGSLASTETNLKVTSATGRLTTESGGRIVLGDNDWPIFSAARSRSIWMPIDALGFQAQSGNIEFGTFGSYPDTIPYLKLLSNRWSQAGLPFLHNGATLSNVRLFFRADTTASLGTTPIRLGVRRIPFATGSTTVPTPQVLGAASFDTSPYVAATYTDKFLSLDVPMVAYNVIDTGVYVYSLNLINTVGSGAIYALAARFDYASISDMCFP